jgi:hypothetical protein
MSHTLQSCSKCYQRLTSDPAVTIGPFDSTRASGLVAFQLRKNADLAYDGTALIHQSGKAMLRFTPVGKTRRSLCPHGSKAGVVTATIPLHLRFHDALRLGNLTMFGLARAKGGEKSAIARPSHQGFVSHLSTNCAGPGAYPPLRTADAAACSRVVLGRSSNSC